MYCNCLTFVLLNRIRSGGHICWYRSRTWWGFHTTWIDRQGREWEYTLKKIKKQPWWYIPFCYYDKGIIKRVR